jgi:hypothetical protein
MKKDTFSPSGSSLLAILCLVVAAGSSLAQRAPYVYIYAPTNGASFLAPANLTLCARAIGSTAAVQRVEFFAGGASLGVATNIPGAPGTNGTSEPVYALAWPNVQAGSYALSAVATDITGLAATSSVVKIAITNPPVPRPSVYIYSPPNGAKYAAPASLTIYARAVEQNGTVQTVEFFAGDVSLGVASSPVVVSNISTAPLFPLPWSNVAAGIYALKAIATDANGLTATSSVVTITVTNPPVPRPSVAIYSPANGAKYAAPASLTIYARAVEQNGTVQTVQFFAGDTSLGVATSPVVVSNISTAPLFPLPWSNVAAGTYALKAIATDANGLTATSSVVTITVTNPPVYRPAVYIYSPTNGARFAAPASLTIYARAYEQNGTVQTVEFFAGDTSLGVASSPVVVSNLSKEPFFLLPWSNVPAGNYPLKAVATDANGLTATSSVVTITVYTNPPPPNVPFTISLWYPTNGQSFIAPATVAFRACVTDSNVVRTVAFYSGDALIGTASNASGILLTNPTSSSPFYLVWSNVAAGSYVLKALATDAAGLMATSAPVNISVVPRPPETNRPPSVRITSPPNAAVFRTPVNIPLYAYAYDPNGFVATVEFLAGSNSLGFGSLVLSETNSGATSYRSNYFFLVWSNVPMGTYALTARATDNEGVASVSAPVKISVLAPTPETNRPGPVVFISATDPVAIEGTNCWTCLGLSNSPPTWTNWALGTKVPVTNCGPKNATFSVYRSGDTNAALTVYYMIGGTATNGVDYLALPGVVTIPAGQRLAMIAVVPLDDGAPDLNSTVILTLAPSTQTPPTYTVGSSPSAAVVILDSVTPNRSSEVLPGRTFHVKASGPDGAWFRIEYSTDLVTWTPICTNQVVNGSIDFVDPTASSAERRYYRAVPEADPAP